MEKFLPTSKESAKVFFAVLFWFAILLFLAVSTSCTKLPVVKMSKSQVKMAKVSSWNYNR